jgi:hypothetical protein
MCGQVHLPKGKQTLGDEKEWHGQTVYNGEEALKPQGREL